MTDLFFVDTNVLVYNRDSSLPEKQTKAQAWLQRLWTERSGVVSYQVLSEFYVTVGGCRRVLTEDLQEGQNLDGVLVVNPFHTAP